MKSQSAAFILLCDIGGTHARFGVSYAKDNFTHIETIEKYSTTDFNSLTAAIKHYFTTHARNTNDLRNIYIASAVRPKDGVLKFKSSYKVTSWHIPLKALANDFSMPPQCINVLLDTQAQFLALDDTIDAQDKAQTHAICLKQGRAETPHNQSLLISVGTGLGHAYGSTEKNSFTPTFGGHMPAFASTPAQCAALEYIRTINNGGSSPLIYEDLVSGRGFYNLYLYSCHKHGIAPVAKDIYELADTFVALRKNTVITQTATLFCGFLGLYINLTAMMTFSFKSCTVIGGLLRTLYELDLFDQAALKENIETGIAQSVLTALSDMPVTLVTKPHLSLYGLLNAHQQKGTHDI